MAVSSTLSVTGPVTLTSPQQVISITWAFYRSSEVIVKADGVVLTEGSDYEVAGGNGSGGTVTMTAEGPTTGASVIIWRDIPETHTDDWRAGGPLPGTEVTRAMDRVYYVLQQLRRTLKLGLTLAIGSREQDPIEIGAVPGVLGHLGDGKLTALTGEQLRALIESGYVISPGTRVFADADARASAVPNLIGQIGVQLDSISGDLPGAVYIANGLTDGAWEELDVSALPWSRITGKPTSYASDFGIVADGVTDCTTAFQAAIDAISADGGGVLSLAEGTYLVAGLVIKDNVQLIGASKKATIIKLKSSSNAYVVRGGSFDTLADGSNHSDLTGACVSAALRDLTLDGNKSGQGVAKHGLAYYGVDLFLDNVQIRDCKGVGLYCESPGSAHSSETQNLQHSFDHIEVNDNDGGNIVYNGQSDSTLTDVICYNAGDANNNVWIKSKSSGLRIIGLHAFGTSTKGLVLDATSVSCTNCAVESASSVKVEINANSCRFDGDVYEVGAYFDSTAFKVADGVVGVQIRARVSAIKTALNPGTSSNCLYDLMQYSNESTAVLWASAPAVTNWIRALRYGGGVSRTVTQSPSQQVIDSDASVQKLLTNGHSFGVYTDAIGSLRQFNVEHTAAATGYLSLTGGTNSGSGGPQVIARGTDADYNVRLTPKGAGKVWADTDIHSTTSAIPARFFRFEVRKASATNGGDFTQGVWTPRSLNTEVTDAFGIAALNKASVTLTKTGAFAGNEQVTLDTTTYTLKSSLTPAEGEILIGASDSETLDNIKLAINRTDPGSNDGVKYKCAAAHSTVEATDKTATTLKFEARTAGGDGNTIASTETCANASFGAATLTGGARITLPAGTYQLRASAPGYRCGAHKVKIYNVTAASDIAVGTSESSYTGGANAQTHSTVTCVVTFAVETTIELQHRCSSTKPTDGMGVASGMSVSEVYAWLEGWQLS